MTPEFYKREHCRLCDSKDLELVIQLAPTPPGNHFVSADKVGLPQTSYPLQVNFCLKCHHLQLAHVVNPEILYQKNYSYVSGTSPVFVKHLREYAAEIIDRFAIPQGALVLDIGSNDGTALSFFKDAGYRVLGIDPAIEIVATANKKGIPTLCEFFDREVAEKYSPQYGPASLINSHNTCAHIDDLKSVMQGVRQWLADDGIFMMEVGYLVDIFQNVWFDTIYHEHLDFHSVEPLLGFFQRAGFEVLSVQRTSQQGGSIRLISQKLGGPRKADNSAQDLVRLEHSLGLDQAETFRNFNLRLNEVKAKLSRLIKDLKAEKKTIAAYGAPTKATTLLTYFDLGDALDFLVDDNPLKQNLFSPGHHIPVYSAESLYTRKPDYLLILAWNFAEDIMRRHSAYEKQGGRFVVPMPEPRVVN